jgi:hypothetical protein
LNESRPEPINFKYFQYLAILFTEIYLDRLFSSREAFLRELNTFVDKLNTSRGWKPPAAPFKDSDLAKVAFLMATGSGKTIIMHVNLWQYLDYCSGKVQHDNILLITPSGLTSQHLGEFHKSGIIARYYDEAEGSSSHGESPVIVIEITKFKLPGEKQGEGETIEVDTFGENNLVFVDEGHRGASGEKWRTVREYLGGQGFTFEYSATFRQTVNGASATKRPALLEEYSKAILLDYSYPYFHKDGFGKDYWVLNIKEETSAFNNWMILGNMLSFYEQLLLYEENSDAFQAYNIEKPLWVFVGHSVTGGSKNEEEMTDVEQSVAFFDNFLRHRDRSVQQIAKVLANKTGLRDKRDQDLFKDILGYLRQRQFRPDEIYDEIVKTVFQAKPGETLRAVRLVAAPGEIALRAGADSPYFGVINIGDVSGLIERLEDRGIACAEENASSSLFDSIRASDSTINILVGARKFMEGWDCFRVASMGLMNIGRSEGAQIIQLFGRGVRLWGRKLPDGSYSLKRTSALSDDDHAPSNIRLLETLNVFGVRANYMGKFRDYLKQEGMDPESEGITVPIKVQNRFLRRKLQILRLTGSKSFLESECLPLDLDTNLRVQLDLSPQYELAQSVTGEETLEKLSGTDRTGDLRGLLPFLDWDRIFFELLEFKRTRSYHNLVFDKSQLQKIVEVGNYSVLCPDGVFPIRSFRDLGRAEDMVASLLRKYVSVYYDRHRRTWEQSYLRFAALNKADRNLSFKSYSIRAKSDLIDRLDQLVKQGNKLARQEVEGFNIHFDRHMYLPLILDDAGFEFVSPAGLNPGEKKFIKDLREYLMRGKFRKEQVFVLRNLTRGRGMSFVDSIERGAFYPDFILWIVKGLTQWVTFVEPHGLLMERMDFVDNPKIRLHKELKALERTLQPKTIRIHLNSFVVSVTSLEVLRKRWPGRPTKASFEAEHVLFQEDGDYIEKLFTRILQSW